VNRDHEDKREFDVLLRMPVEERTIQVAEDEHIWDAAFRQGLILPALCHQGWCLTCAGRTESGEVDQRDSVGFFPQDKDAGFVLLCTGRPLSNLCIQTHQAMAMRKHRLALGLPAPYSTGLKP
jgi:ferredoxin